MCTFGVLGLSCASPGGPVWWGRRGFTRQPENSRRAHLRVPAFKNTTKIQREDLSQRKERMKFPAGERKKSAKFWARPPFRAPPFGPHPSGPTLRAGPHPSGPHPSGPLGLARGLHKKNKQLNIDKKQLTQKSKQLRNKHFKQSKTLTLAKHEFGQTVGKTSKSVWPKSSFGHSQFWPKSVWPKSVWPKSVG